MNTKPFPSVSHIRSKVSVEHQRQVIWQIFLPLGLFVMVISFLAILAGISSTRNISDANLLSSISLIWMIFPVLMGGLLLFLFIGAAIYALSRILQILPVYSGITFSYFEIARNYIRIWSDRVVQPIISTKVALNGMRTLIMKIPKDRS